MRRCLIVFAREPEKGRVKTRLKGYLSDAQCLNLYKGFLKDTIDMANSVACEEKVLAYASTKRHPGFLKKFGDSFILFRQKGGDLGERMHNAFVWAARNNAAKIVIIGSDSPDLPARYIDKAFAGLEENDVALGPAIDGGYYLVGLKKPDKALFQGIRWGSATVFEDTLEIADHLKKRVVLLPRWHDVDDAQALSLLSLRLKRNKDKGIAKWTRGFLKI